jgi:hypothetical protein
VQNAKRATVDVGAYEITILFEFDNRLANRVVVVRIVIRIVIVGLSRSFGRNDQCRDALLIMAMLTTQLT